MARVVVAAVAAVAYGVFTEDWVGAFKVGAVVYGLGAGLDPNTKVQGPRLDDLKGPKASEGAPIPYIQGSWRTAGTYIWCSDKQEVAHEESQGKGGPGVDSTTFTYKIDVLILFSINELAALRRVWSNGKLVWSVASDDADSLEASAETDSWEEIRFYTGAPDQLPDPDYEAAVGVGNAPAYRGRATVFIKGLNLGGSGQLPVLNFEVLSKATTSEVDATVRLQVTFDGGNANDESAYAAAPSISGDLLVLDDGLGDDEACIGTVAPLDSGMVSYESVGLQWTKESYTVQGRYVELRPEADHATQIIFTYDYGASGEYLSLSIGGDLGGGIRSMFLEDSNFGTLITTTSPGGMFHWCVMFDSDANVAHLYLDGVHKGAATHAPPAASVITAGIRFGAYPNPSPGSPQQQRFNNLRLKRGLEFDLAGFVPPETLPPVDGATVVVELQTEDLADVVSRLCIGTGLLTADDIDVTDLVGIEVRGIAISSGTARQALEILMAAYLFEAVESEKLRFVRRGGVSVATIPYTALGASIGEPIEPLPTSRANDIELPARISVKYANALNDYQDGAASSDRLITESTAVSSVELPVVMTPLEAARIADSQALDLQISLISIGPLSLTRAYAALEPTDVVLVEAKDGSQFRARLTKVTDTGGTRTLEAVLDDATIVDSNAAGDETDHSTVLVRAVSDTSGLFIDGPIARDADNDQGFYLLAKPSDPTKAWSAGVVYSSRDGVSYEREDSISERAIFGPCQTVLGDWTGPRVFDEMNTVTVDIGEGVTLSSATRDAMLNDQAVNAFAIGSDSRGWEYGQFRTATLLSDGVYRLSGLLRGSRGTEWAMTGHEASETFALLRPAGMRRILIDTSAVGSERFYKIPTSGKSLASATAVTFTDNAIGLKPFSPFDARQSIDSGTGDITLTWQRRSRLQVRTIGAMGISVPLGEEVEAYAVDIFADDTFATVLRTLTASSASVVYTAAMQSADGYVPGDDIFVRIYQLSTVVGRGYALEATL